jgi:hypothetical protein
MPGSTSQTESELQNSRDQFNKILRQRKVWETGQK